MAEQIHMFDHTAPADRPIDPIADFKPPPPMVAPRPEVAEAIKSEIDELYLKTRDRRCFVRCLRAWEATLVRSTDPEAESRYVEAIDGWGRETVQHAVAGFGLLTQHFFIDGGFYDVLGDVYMRIRDDWGGSYLGQYFTPWPLARMMARLTVEEMANLESRLEGGETITLHDPACGSMVMGLAAKSVIAERYGRKALRQVRMCGQDIDEVCCLMAKIQTLMTDSYWMRDLNLALAGEVQRAKGAA